MQKKEFLVIFAVPLVAVLLFGAALTITHSSEHTTRSVGATAEAALVSPNGTEMGTVTITQGPKGIVLAAKVQGLAPGGHALSLNFVGACVPNFEAGGGDFAPHGGEHGFLQGDGPHVGDLPNIYAGANGTARADFFASDVTLSTGGDHSIFDDDGSSIIIHENPDTYVEEGALGERVACGVIRRN